jgi:hypothetical protein
MLDLEARLTADLADAAQAADLRPPDRQTVAATAALRRHRRRVRTTVLAVAATVIVAAGAVAALGAVRDHDQTVVNEPTTTVTTTVVPPTSEIPGTTSSTASTTSSTTTPAATGDPSLVPVSVNLVLRPDGIGRFDFGAPQDEVLGAVTAELGEPLNRYQGGGPSQGCEPAAEEVAWIGLLLRFEGPDPGSLRLTGWSAGYGNAQAPRTFRMQDGPALGEPVPVWQAAYGPALRVESSPGPPEGYQTLTLDLDGVTFEGSAGPDVPVVVNGMTRMTTNCSLGDY